MQATANFAAYLCGRQWKEVKRLKRIVAAWIEQILEFDGKLEYMPYMEGLKQKGQRFKEISFDQLESGVVKIRIRKQYNNNMLPEE